MHRNVWWVLFGLALVGSVALGFMGEGEPVYIWDFALFFAIFGLGGCLLLSYLAKGLVSPVMDRPEDFYGPQDAQNDWSTQSPAAAPAGPDPVQPDPPESPGSDHARRRPGRGADAPEEG